MLSKDASVFLKKYPPFNLMDDHALGRLVALLVIKLYPSGALILGQGDPSSRGLYIIKEGSAKIFAHTSPGQKHVLDYRNVGETFGFLSLGENECMDVSVQAVSDTVCYVVDNAAVMKLLDDYPSFREYLLPSYFPKRGDMLSGTPASHKALHMGSERALFTTPVRDLAGPDVVTARSDVSILDAAGLMTARRISALVIVNEYDQPVGIVTSTDLRDRALVSQKDTAGPVSDIMSKPLVMIDGADFCFEALLKMMSHEVHHLLVTDSGRLAGVVSNHDFMVLQGISPLIIIKEIEEQSTVDSLASASGKVMGLISLLLEGGATAVSILRIISNVNDRIERKILDFALKTLGPPPAPFCWIVYGSAGRKEQTFKTDQDNAIIYKDPADEKERGLSAGYFGRFSEFVVDAFLRCGFKLCPGDFMSTNPRWRQPISVWKKSFSNWICAPANSAIHHAANLFDFRGLHGDMGLANELKKHLMRSLPDQKIFLKALADLTTDYRPPLSLFGSLKFEKNGDHVNHLDLKAGCLTPLINIVRLFSFESNVPETSTTERIAVLKNIHPIMKKTGDDLGHAFEFITLLRIRRQLEQASMGIDPDNFIDPKRLSSLEIRNLKEICKLITRIIDDIAKSYCTGTQL